MFSKKEILSILVAIVIITVSISLIESWKVFAFTLLMVFLVIAINVLVKKAAGYYLDSEIEVRLWEIKRFGFKPHREFKRGFPAGIIFPILFSLLSFGSLMWLASLIFEVKPTLYRAAKRHGLYSFSEMTEYQIGLIAAAGVVANLIFGAIGYIVGWPMFTQLNLWLAFFNMIPVSDLDGNKIFFGNLVIWSFLATITLIGIAYAFLLI